jgi:2-polyprenyl-6-methoxyphenol hydroxylase-like FAD-dependent oxidoreductase
MLTEQCRQHPSFQLHMGTAVRDLTRSGDRVVGMKIDGRDGPRELTADLVIGTDGRFSTVRSRAGFIEPRSPQHFDVLNFMVPFPNFWPDRTTVRLELGAGCITGGIPTADGRLWVGLSSERRNIPAIIQAASSRRRGWSVIGRAMQGV